MRERGRDVAQSGVDHGRHMRREAGAVNIVSAAARTTSGRARIAAFSDGRRHDDSLCGLWTGHPRPDDGKTQPAPEGQVHCGTVFSLAEAMEATPTPWQPNGPWWRRPACRHRRQPDSPSRRCLLLRRSLNPHPRRPRRRAPLSPAGGWRRCLNHHSEPPPSSARSARSAAAPPASTRCTTRRRVPGVRGVLRSGEQYEESRQG